jgi:hypothetical protein
MVLVVAVRVNIDHPGFVPWQRTAALAASALGQPEQARDLACEMLERARWTGAARALGLALRTQAAVGGTGQRVPLLAEAVDVLRPSASALQRAHALVELGAAYRRAGQRSAAQPPLREGLQLADHMGASPLMQAARHELKSKASGDYHLGMPVFADFGFKLLVIDKLMYDEGALIPKFSIDDRMAARGILDPLDYVFDNDLELVVLDESRDYFETLEISEELLASVETLNVDGGAQIYFECSPAWDGETDQFDIRSFEDVALLPNLQRIVGADSCGIVSADLVEDLRARGIATTR